jgi:hypothetical protein
MEIVIPFDMTSKQSITVYRYHDDVSEALTQNPSEGKEGYVVNSDSITVYAKKFSTYAIGYTVSVPAANNKPSSGSSSSSSGSSSSSSRTYTITNNIGGIVTASAEKAASGETVTLTVIPDSGYTLEELLVVDANGKAVTLTKISDDKYTFVMPASKVSVDAQFVTTDQHEDCPSKAFVDLDSSLWYHEYVDYVLTNGLMGGYGSGVFGPNDSLTRGQLMTILARMAGQTAQSVSEGVAWAVANGISDGTNPGEVISRQQLATMLWRYAGSPTVSEDATFTDAAQISSYAVDAVKWATKLGILSGYSDGSVKPRSTATRAHASKMLTKFAEK